jgi:hypothetical protein
MIWNITGPQIFSIIPLISKGMIDGAARLEEGIKAGESPQKLQALTLQIKKAETAYSELASLASMLEQTGGKWLTEFSGLAMNVTHITPDDWTALKLAADNPEDSSVVSRGDAVLLTFFPNDMVTNLQHCQSESMQEIIKWVCESGYQMVEFRQEVEPMSGFPLHKH